MKLTTETIEMLRKNIKMKNLLALNLGKSVQTIENWIRANHPNLTRLQALEIIEQETGISKEKLVEESQTTYA